MSKFAQYFLMYRDDNLFAHLEWDRREDLLAEFLADEDGVQFADRSQNESEATDGSVEEPKQRIKIYRHKIYHLTENERIIVMRIANVKIIPIEKDFKPESVEHYPSVFVIFDRNQGDRNFHTSIYAPEMCMNEGTVLCRLIVKSGRANSCERGNKSGGESLFRHKVIY